MTQLSLCTSTLVADPFSYTEDDLHAALAAAKGAGYSGISFWTFHHTMLTLTGTSADDFATAVAEAGLVVDCLEALAGWANAPGPDQVLAEAMPALELAEGLGVKNLVAVCMDAEIASFDVAAGHLALIADRAADVGVTVSVEFLPWSAVPDIATCWNLIQRTERDNAKILLDAWHWHRQPGGDGDANAEVLASLPSDAIGVFQICDVAAGSNTKQGEDMLAEAMTERPLPGEGDVDFGRLLGMMDGIGAQPYVAAEVFNADLLAAEGPVGFAAAVADASRAVLGGSLGSRRD